MCWEKTYGTPSPQFPTWGSRPPSSDQNFPMLKSVAGSGRLRRPPSQPALLQEGPGILISIGTVAEPGNQMFEAGSATAGTFCAMASRWTENLGVGGNGPLSPAHHPGRMGFPERRHGAKRDRMAWTRTGLTPHGQNGLPGCRPPVQPSCTQDLPSGVRMAGPRGNPHPHGA